jgi:hypothetical protein
MDDFSSGGPRGPDRPLESKTTDGKTYRRFESNEAAIAWAESVHESVLLAQKEELPAEAIVYMICKIGKARKELFGELAAELIVRIADIGGAFVLRLPEIPKEHILYNVQDDILKLIMSGKSSKEAEILQVTFGLAVKRRVLNEAKKYRRSALGRRGKVVPQDPEADDEEQSRPLEQAPDTRPNQEAELLKSEEQDQIQKLAGKARRAVKDPRAREAAWLYYAREMPIQSDDPRAEDIMRRVNATRREVYSLKDKGMRAMRKALGVKK